VSLLAAGFLAVDRAFAPVSFFGGDVLAVKYERLRALELEQDVRVLVLGPSYADLGVDAERLTERTGMLTFNMGIPGTDLALQAELLRDVLIPLVEPEVVLWCLREDLRSPSLINRQYLNAPALGWAGGIGGYGAFEFVSHLPQYQKRRLAAWAEEFRTPKEVFDALGHGDMRELHRDFGGGDLEDARAAGSGRGESVTEEFARATFEDALRCAQEHRVKVFAFLAPFHRDLFIRQSGYTRALLTGKYDEYGRWLRSTLAEHEIPFVDLHCIPQISEDESYFYDGRHLNRVGATPFTDVLADFLLGKTIPPEWRAHPSPTEVEAMLGPPVLDGVPMLATGERHALRAARLVEEQGRVVDLYARFALERPGRYRVELSGGKRAEDASYYVRAGGERWIYWEPRGEPAESDVLALDLPAGEVVLELHRGRNRAGIERASFALLPDAPPIGGNE